MGKFIVIEGLDGSGKHTQMLNLDKYLRERGDKTVCLEFPCYGTPGCAMAERYLSGEFGQDPNAVNPYAASLFFAIDRFYSYRTAWRDRLDDEDTFVLADRYTTANAIHQSSKLPDKEKDAYLDWLFDTEYSKLGLPCPDAVVYLELTPSLSEALVEKRSVTQGRALDIHEKDASFYTKSYQAALYCADKYGWLTLRCYDKDSNGNDFMKSRDEIFSEMRDILTCRGII